MNYITSHSQLFYYYIFFEINYIIYMHRCLNENPSKLLGKFCQHKQMQFYICIAGCSPDTEIRQYYSGA